MENSTNSEKQEVLKPTPEQREQMRDLAKKWGINVALRDDRDLKSKGKKTRALNRILKG